MIQTSRKELTYCLSHTVVLTRRCAYACGYCDYPVSPSWPLLSRKALRKRLKRAAHSGAVQVELTAGEGIADISETISVVRYYGLNDYTEYLTQAFQEAAGGDGWPGLLPVPHVGNLSFAQLQRIKRHIACLKIFLESADCGLLYQAVHGESACKALEKRLETILHAGQENIPVTTGILVGIGETRASRDRALSLLAEAHRRFGHIQDVVIERFVPKPGTPMATWPAGPADEVLRSVGVARKIFGPDFPVTVSALRNPDLLEGCLEAGVNDFGAVEVTGFPESDDETLQRLHLVRSFCEDRGHELRERLPVFPSHQSERWLSPEMLELVRLHRSEGLPVAV